MEDLALIRSLLTKEEPIADPEQEQEDEVDYEVEEPRDEASQSMYCGISMQMGTMMKKIVQKKFTLMKYTHEVKGHLRM